MIAGLPMYDLEELRWAHDALWQGLARALGEAPPRLAWDMSAETQWRSPDLLLSQTCGYPLRHALAGRVAYVATPCYAAPGCDGPTYSSAIVVPRGADGVGARRAINAPDSWSGRFALERALPDAAFAETLWTGSHAASLTAVASGAVDVAAIDAVTFALLSKHRPAAVAGVRVVRYTEPAPALPYVTRPGGPVRELRRAWRQAIADPALAEARKALLLDDVVVLDAEAYAVMDDAREVVEA